MVGGGVTELDIIYVQRARARQLVIRLPADSLIKQNQALNIVHYIIENFSHVLTRQVTC